MITWAHLGDAMPMRPAWSTRIRNFRAPHVVRATEQSRYVMYYSARHDTTETMCIGVATSIRPDGPFADVGSPLACGPGFTHIDPMAFDDSATGRSSTTSSTPETTAAAPPRLRGDRRALAQPARPLRADGDGEGVDQQRDRRPQRRLEGPRVITRSSATRAATTGSCTTPSIRPTRCRAGPASCGGRCSWIACAGTRRAGPGSRSARRRGAFCHRRCRRWWRCTDPARTRAGRAHRRAAVGRSTVRPCVIASTAARAKGTGKKRSSAQSGNRSR